MEFRTRDFSWEQNRLYCRRKLTGFSIVQDETYPVMWRVRRPDGTLTDMVNRTRARDAAQFLALTALNMNT